jgi:hypothetical protein
LIERRQALLTDLLRVGRGTFGMLGSGWETKLVSSLVEEVKGRSPGAFSTAFEEMLTRFVVAGSEPATFNEIVTVLWRHLAPCSAGDNNLRTALELILDEARLTTVAAVQRAQGANLFKYRLGSRAFLNACAQLSTATSLEHLGRLLQEFGSAVGVSHLDLALYPDGTLAESAVRVLTYIDRGARLASAVVRASELPRIVLAEQPALPGLIFTTLEFGTETLGVVATNLGAGEGGAFEPLRFALATAIKGTMLREQLQRLGGF